MSVDEDKVTCRSLSSLTQCEELPSTRPPKQRLGSQHRPLLHIEPDRIVVDILHLMLRIMDILLRNLILLMAELDVATRQRGVTEHMDMFNAAVRSRGMIIMNMPVITYVYSVTVVHSNRGVICSVAGQGYSWKSAV